MRGMTIGASRSTRCTRSIAALSGIPSAAVTNTQSNCIGTASRTSYSTTQIVVGRVCCARFEFGHRSSTPFLDRAIIA